MATQKVDAEVVAQKTSTSLALSAPVGGIIAGVTTQTDAAGLANITVMRLKTRIEDEIRTKIKELKAAQTKVEQTRKAVEAESANLSVPTRFVQQVLKVCEAILPIDPTAHVVHPDGNRNRGISHSGTSREYSMYVRILDDRGGELFKAEKTEAVPDALLGAIEAHEAANAVVGTLNSKLHMLRGEKTSLPEKQEQIMAGILETQVRAMDGGDELLSRMDQLGDELMKRIDDELKG